MKNLLSGLPAPWELINDPTTMLILLMYLILMVWEGMFPARQLPQLRYWHLRGLMSFVVFFFLSSYLPMIWDQYLAAYQLFDLSGLGTWLGFLAAFVLYEFGLFAWHFALHRSDFLWKVFHQMHHSAERLDTYGAFYFSPMDMIGFTFLGSLCLVLVAGFTPQATTIFILVTTFLSIFQHSNIRTPRWLGYFVQRPEAHAVHHARNIHDYNYSDLPVIDMLFGTFNNPKTYEHTTGFYDGASSRIWEMLTFRDVSVQKKKSKSLDSAKKKSYQYSK